MNADIFAEWFHRQDYHVVRTKSSYWVRVTGPIYQAFPYHLVIEPEEEELQELFNKHKALGLRYSAPFNSPRGAVSYHIVYEGANYTLDGLSKQSRKNVRKAMREMKFEPISFRMLAIEGWQARAETLERQGRSNAENRAWWYKLCRCAEALKGFEAWGAILDRELVASLITFTCDSCCSILYQQSKTECLKRKVNNLLIFALTHEVLRRPSTNWIFSGMQSLDAPSSLDDFKFTMNYTAKPIRQNVLFHRLLAPFFNSKSHKLLTHLQHWKPEIQVLSKAEGMIRFFIEGRRPLSEQTWPQALGNQRAELLNCVN